MPGAIVIGAGPGIGVAVARRLARERLPVGVVARAPATVEAALAALADAEVRTYGAVADATDEDALREALDGYVERLGVPDVLVYNAAIIQWDELGELTAGQHLDAWAVNVVGAITAAAHLLPRMADAGGGTFLLTSGMPTPVPGGAEPVARQGRRARAGRGARTRSSGPPASTSRRSPSPERSRPGRRSIRTRSPSTTGGSTRRRPTRGSTSSSTTAEPPRRPWADGPRGRSGNLGGPWRSRTSRRRPSCSIRSPVS